MARRIPKVIGLAGGRELTLNGYDIAYGIAVAAAAPVWLAKPAARHKVLCALGQRMGHVLPREETSNAVLIHAVSLGEMNATRELVAQLKSHRPDLHVIVSTTTTTGYERGRQLYAGKPGMSLVRFPLDFSSAVNMLLDALQPSLIVLMEGEIWPNFLLQCHRRKIPVVLVNGRMTESAFRRYRRVRFLTSSMLRRIETICAQDAVYAERFTALGAPQSSVQITGTMKFDTASIADSVPGDQELADELGLADPQDPLWVCGSTGPGEEALLLEAYCELLTHFPNLRLAIIPRKPERFDEVAELITARGFELLRRSETTGRAGLSSARDSGLRGSETTGRAGPSSARNPGRGRPGSPVVILGDTMGELRKFYSLATVVFVGRSLVDLGSRQWGSDMIEPAALAKPVAIGPWTHNFAEAVRSFKSAQSMVEVSNVQGLVKTIAGWLSDPASGVDLGQRAQAVVKENQGATARNVKVILEALPGLVA
jgi:3-deoxy-D-manno-octulosonic-acid transferase